MKKILKLLSIVIMLTVATIYTMPTKVLAFGPSSNEIYNGIKSINLINWLLN